MPDYSKGKIYKLTGAGKIYIGSTTQLLSKRYWAHKNQTYKTVQEIIADPNNQITLIELFPCSSKEELLARERYHIEQNKCINKYCPILSEEERNIYIKQRNKKYSQTEKGKLAQKLYKQTPEQRIAQKAYRERKKAEKLALHQN
jgi:hypothetical protein